MRMYLFVILVSVVTGCTHGPMSPPVEVSSAKPSSSQLVMDVTNALEKSRTFRDLKHRAKKPMVFINEQSNGWVTVDIGNLSEDFFHRWATLKIDTNTGTIMKLGTDEKLEDEWMIEFQGQK